MAVGSGHPITTKFTHHTRQALYDHIETTPAIHLSDLGKRVEASFSTVRHHLRELERDNHITSKKISSRRRYFTTRVTKEDGLDTELYSALTDAPDSLVRALDATDDLYGTELAAATDRDVSTISHHLTQLAEAGALVRERDGRTVVNRLTPAAKDVVDEQSIREREVTTAQQDILGTSSD